jgi:hypothetical protein
MATMELSLMVDLVKVDSTVLRVMGSYFVTRITAFHRWFPSQCSFHESERRRIPYESSQMDLLFSHCVWPYRKLAKALSEITSCAAAILIEMLTDENSNELVSGDDVACFTK